MLFAIRTIQERTGKDLGATFLSGTTISNSLTELYLLIKTEDTIKEGLALKQNRFYVEGEGNVKYTYNNGYIANDPKLAVEYFIHALEKIPTLIETHEKKNAELLKDLPVLQEVAKSVWRKEDELKGLKSEVAAIERKIELSLKPIDQEEDKKENTQEYNQTIKGNVDYAGYLPKEMRKMVISRAML